VLVSKKVSFGHKGQGGWVEDECLIGWPKPRFEEMVCRSGERSSKFH